MTSIYKRYSIPVTSIGPDGVQRVVAELPVECHDHMRMGEMGDRIFNGVVQRTEVPTGDPFQTNSNNDDHDNFEPDGVLTADDPTGGPVD